MTTSVKGEDRLEEIKAIICAEFDPTEGGDAVDGPDWDWDYKAAEKIAERCARQIAALPCKGSRLVPLSEDGQSVFLDGFGSVALDLEGRLAALSAPSTKPDRESADEGALREALGELLAAHVETWAFATGRRDTLIDTSAVIERTRRFLSALSKDTEASAGEQGNG